MAETTRAPAEPRTDPGGSSGGPSRTKPLIEMGWLVVGRLETPDREAVEVARAQMVEELSAAFPQFSWRMPLLEREAPVSRAREQPVELLDQAVVERQAKGWDFALVVTGADLLSYYKPFALGAPARSLSVAAVSTIRIDPEASGRGWPGEDRAEVMARRLNGLEHGEEPWDYMADVDVVGALDRMERFSEASIEELSGELADVADLRLEERGGGITRSRFAFYLRTAWHNADDIFEAVSQARPWQFPLRLSRLTTAAFSALVILMVTAEVWDLGMSQPAWLVATLSGIILVVTSGYILGRQQLLVHRESERLTELGVVSNLSMVLAVLLGMVTTYAVLFGVVLLLARTVYSRSLVAGWAASLHGPPDFGHYLVFSGFVASLGLAIGALGASFEEQGYFRHVAYVDEET